MLEESALPGAVAAISAGLEKLGLKSPSATSSSSTSAPPSTKRKWRVTVLISGSGSNLQALLDSLPTTLDNASIVAVLANKPTAFGLIRARTHVPPIPALSLSLKQFCDSPSSSHPFIPAAQVAASDENKAKMKAAKAAYLLEFSRRVKETRPDLIVLAGWMLILSPEALDALTHDWEEGVGSPVGALETEGATPYPSPIKTGAPIPIINLHPALPGTFPGAHGISDAWDAFNAPVKEGERRIEKTGIMIHRVIPELDAGPPVLVKEVEMKKGETLEELENRIHAVEHKAIVEAVGTVLNSLEDGTWWTPDN